MLAEGVAGAADTKSGAVEDASREIQNEIILDAAEFPMGIEEAKERGESLWRGESVENGTILNSSCSLFRFVNIGLLMVFFQKKPPGDLGRPMN